MSYFGFEANAYPAGRFERFKRDAAGLDLSAPADEALERHHTISLVALKKSRGVRHSGIASIAAIAVAVMAMVARSA